MVDVDVKDGLVVGIMDSGLLPERVTKYQYQSCPTTFTLLLSSGKRSKPH